MVKGLLGAFTKLYSALPNFVQKKLGLSTETMKNTIRDLNELENEHSDKGFGAGKRRRQETIGPEVQKGVLGEMTSSDSLFGGGSFKNDPRYKKEGMGGMFTQYMASAQGEKDKGELRVMIQTQEGLVPTIENLDKMKNTDIRAETAPATSRGAGTGM